MSGLKLLLAVAVLGGFACAKPPEPAPPEEPLQPITQDRVEPPSGDGMTIVSPAAGGMSPVYGGEGVQGGTSGGGVGAAAKDRARGVADRPTSSLDSLGGSEGE